MTDDVFELHEGSIPLIVNFPHSGTRLPASLSAAMTPAGLNLPDTDWNVPALYSFAQSLGAWTLTAHYSRYVVDLNRPRDGKPLYPGQFETGVCPRLTFDGRAIFRERATDEPTQLAARLDAYWEPYHRRLEQLVEEVRATYGRCVLWDAHSIRSHVPALFDGRLPDLNLGTARGSSCAGTLGSRLLRELEQQPFSFVVDGRFTGGFITRHYGRPDRGVDAVQMEIAQAIYMDEEQPHRFEPGRAAPLALVLQRLLQAAVQSARGKAS